jgi:hypothetical protein
VAFSVVQLWVHGKVTLLPASICGHPGCAFENKIHVINTKLITERFIISYKKLLSFISSVKI